VAGVALAGILLVVALHAREWFSVQGMRSVVAAWGPLGPLAFVGVFVSGFFVPGPEILFAALGGVLFGRVAGFAWSWIAVMIGTTLTFCLVRFTAQEAVQRALRDRFPSLHALDDRLAHQGVLTIVVLRLTLFLSPPLNWALGTSRVSLHDYVVGTAVGTLPGLAVAVWLGDLIVAAETWADLLVWETAIPLGLLGAFFVGAALVGRRLLAPTPSGRRPGKARGQA
jgi:uncharacterized membrane protein YdjX (TVP38/TMEM64 family)